jgi:type II secretory pathway pseudopilin PulG
MRKILSIIVVIASAAISLAAQTTQERRHHSEVMSVTSKADTKISEAGNGAFYPHTSYRYPIQDFKPGVVRVGPRTTYLKDGFRIDEVVRLLGKPLSISVRSEGNIVVQVYAFQRGEGRVLVSEFENGLLVRSRIESPDEQQAQADR